MNAPDRYAQFLAMVEQIGISRRHALDLGLYRRLKDELVRDCPDITPEQYTAAVVAIARAVGI